MKLRLSRQHPYATYVDKGRFHLRSRGVPWSGPVDDLSYAIAQRAVGNKDSDVALEIRGLGFQGLVEEAGALCWVGAHASVCINGQAFPPQYRANLKSGDTLEVGLFEVGSTLYIATPGGWIAPFFSESACGPCRELMISSAGSNLTLHPGALSSNPLEGLTQPIRIPVRSWFVNGFNFQDVVGTNAAMLVDSSSNRFGVRLNGDLNGHSIEIASQPTMPGMIQWTPSGQLIIVGVDGPTMGGYPIIGYIPKSALHSVGQLKAGDIVEWALHSTELEATIEARWQRCLEAAELSALMN